MPWSDGLPRVSVPQSDQPKAVTIILPYYENAQFFRAQVTRWRQFTAHLRAHLSAVVVDDVSVDAPLTPPVDPPFPIATYRLLPPKRPWNWLAARNLGAHVARDGWLLLTDMDHVIPPSTVEALVYGLHHPQVVYAFERIEGCDTPRTKAGDRIHPHSASFFMTRQMFWTIGGYDERYSGHYGSDGRYRARLRATAPLVVLPERLVRHEYDGDSSTRDFPRKTQADAEALTRIDAVIAASPTPHVLTFPFEAMT